jgi:hypothetical protein
MRGGGAVLRAHLAPANYRYIETLNVCTDPGAVNVEVDAARGPVDLVYCLDQRSPACGIMRRFWLKSVSV